MGRRRDELGDLAISRRESKCEPEGGSLFGPGHRGFSVNAQFLERAETKGGLSLAENAQPDRRHCLRVEVKAAGTRDAVGLAKLEHTKGEEGVKKGVVPIHGHGWGCKIRGGNGSWLKSKLSVISTV